MKTGLLGLKTEPDREKRLLEDEDYSQANELQTIESLETEDEHKKHLEMLVNFVNSLRENGSNKDLNKDKILPGKENRLIEFLANHCSSAFIPISSEEADIFQQRTGSPPSSFTDSQSWIKSEQYQSFIVNVWQVYSKEVEELINNPKVSFLKFWYPAHLWQQYPLGDQLLFDSPTFRLLGHPKSTKTETERDDILSGLESGADHRFGFNCFDLLRDLCSGFFYAVRWMKAEDDKLEEKTTKGYFNPKRKDLLRKCKASELTTGIKIRRTCEQILLNSVSGGKGRKREYCSSACTNRHNQRLKK